MPPLAISRRRHSIFGLYVCVRVFVILYKKFVNTTSYKHVWEFRQIYNLRAVGDKDELVRL